MKKNIQGFSMKDKKLFPNISTQNLKSRVYDLILDLIIDGKLKVGDMLPAERDLSEKMGVSRTVIREAIKSLEARGILTAIHGKGIIVNPININDISRAFMLYLRRQYQKVPLRDLLEVRFIVEPEIAEQAAKKATKEDIEKLEEIIARMEQVRNDVEVFNKTDLEYHLQIGTMTKNIFVTTIMEGLIIPIRESIDETSGADRNKVYREHYEVFKYIKDKDPENAKKAMKKSLKYSQQILTNHGKL